MVLFARGRWVDGSLTSSYVSCRSSPPALRVLDHIGFTGPSQPVRIKRAPYPLIVKPSYPLYPARPLRPLNPARPVNPAGPVNPARPLGPAGLLSPAGSLRPVNP